MRSSDREIVKQQRKERNRKIAEAEQRAVGNRCDTDKTRLRWLKN
ncbi:MULTISPECIES: hypothetical protein [unclassified Microcoleus]|nr:MULTISPECIES: hypothetical protein [unclassified Microcoleus]